MINEQSIPQIHTFTEVEGPKKSSKGKNFWKVKSSTNQWYWIWQENADVAEAIAKNIGVGIKVAVIEGQYPQIVAIEASETAKFIGSLAQDRIQEDITKRVEEKRDLIAWNSAINNATQLVIHDVMKHDWTVEQTMDKVAEWAKKFYELIKNGKHDPR